MATVYRAEHRILGRPVAIKVLPPDLARDEQLMERFRREATLQANLRHPNIVAVHDFIVQDDTYAFVMEYAEGRTLEEVLGAVGGPIPFPRCLSLFLPVLKALGFAHAQGIVHRDVKPSNIVIARVGGEEVVKVVDFGIARVLSRAQSSTTEGRAGTLRYMSPEQCRGARSIDHRVDIYGLGVTLYEMTTGRVPFEYDSEFEMMRAHIEQQPPPPSTFFPAIDPELDRVILTAIAKDPNERFPAIRQFREALEAVPCRVDEAFAAGVFDISAFVAGAPMEADTRQRARRNAASKQELRKQLEAELNERLEQEWAALKDRRKQDLRAQLEIELIRSGVRGADTRERMAANEAKQREIRERLEQEVNARLELEREELKRRRKRELREALERELDE